MKHCTSISLFLVAGIAAAGLWAKSRQMKDEGSSKKQKAIIIIGRLKDFGTRNWRPSVYVDETQLARSQNGRYLVAKVDPGKRTVRAEDPKYSLQIELKAGDCYFFRVEIASGFAKAHGRLVGLTREQGASDLKRLTPIDPSHVKDTSEVLSTEQAAAVAARCAAGPAGSTPPPASSPDSVPLGYRRSRPSQPLAHVSASSTRMLVFMRDHAADKTSICC